MRIIFYLIISIIDYAISDVIYRKVKLKNHRILNIFINLVLYIVIWFVIYGLCLLLNYLLLLILLELGGAPAQD